MKKLLILALIAFVAGGVFAQAAAPVVTMSGQAQYGVLIDALPRGDHKGVVGPGQVTVFIWRMDAQIDANTKAVIRFRERNNFQGAIFSNPTTTPTNVGKVGSLDGTAFGSFFNRAWVETNLLGAFGIDPMMAKYVISFGMKDCGNIDISDTITPYGVADVTARRPGSATQPLIANDITIMNMANLRFVYLPDETERGNNGNGSNGWIVALDGGYGPVTLDIAFHSWYVNVLGFQKRPAGDETYSAPEPGKGTFSFGAKFAQELVKDVNLAAYAGVRYSIWQEQMVWGAAAKVGYQTLVTAWLDATGFTKAKDGLGDYSKDSMFNRMSARVMVTPISLFSFELGSVLNIDKDLFTTQQAGVTGDDAKSILNELIIRGILNVNKTTTFALGYVLLGVEGYHSMYGNEFYSIGHDVSATGKGGVTLELKTTW